MLARRKSKQSRTRPPKREFPRHQKFVRGFICVVPGCSSDKRIQCCHVRKGTDGGTGLKPTDIWTWPGCEDHHAEQHQIGEPAFELKYGLNLKKTALELARRSPDLEVRELARKASA